MTTTYEVTVTVLIDAPDHGTAVKAVEQRLTSRGIAELAGAAIVTEVRAQPVRQRIGG